MITIRELKIEDQDIFISAMQRSQSLHKPWVKAPLTEKEFYSYYHQSQQPNQKSYLVMTPSHDIAGVFNLNEIIRGVFQNAFLGFYGVIDYTKKGYMHAGLKLVLEKAFNELSLHRLEANIQPDNFPSIHLVQKNGFRYEGFSPRYLKIENAWKGHERWAITQEDFIRDDPHIIKKDFIEISSYDPNWPQMVKLEIEKLQKILPANKIIDIQHVGSTAVPGMSAKPIIDIQIAVNSLEEIKLSTISLLQKLNYEYWYENPDPNRMFFAKNMPPYGEKRTHHVHIVEYHSSEWRNKILFRDYLRKHSETAAQYEKLKKQLANDHSFDREKYTSRKTQFINHILQLAAKENPDEKNSG